MLAMCAELGFSLTDDPLEPGVKQVVLSLDNIENVPTG
jgi:hypothetical protein